MPSDATIDVLNQVLEILERSFPQYMLYARPYIPAGQEHVMQTIESICAGENSLAERVTQHVFDSGGLADHGDFPIEFTDTHDLGIEFLVQESIDCLKQNVVDLEECVDALRLAPGAQSLAAEALGLTKGHLELLEDLPNNPAAATLVGPQPVVDKH